MVRRETIRDEHILYLVLLTCHTYMIHTWYMYVDMYVCMVSLLAQAGPQPTVHGEVGRRAAKQATPANWAAGVVLVAVSQVVQCSIMTSPLAGPVYAKPCRRT